MQGLMYNLTANLADLPPRTDPIIGWHNEFCMNIDWVPESKVATTQPPLYDQLLAVIPG